LIGFYNSDIRFVMVTRCGRTALSPSASRERGFFVWDMKTKNKTAAEVGTLARRHSKAAVKVLAAIMNDEEGPATARVSAAQALLDRGWGKAAQVLAGEEGGLPVLARIERVIVESKVIGAQANGDRNSSGEKSGAHTSD
jgi:hypothetical protein